MTSLLLTVIVAGIVAILSTAARAGDGPHEALVRRYFAEWANRADVKAADARIQEIWVHMDRLSFLQQLGLVAAPAQPPAPSPPPPPVPGRPHFQTVPAPPLRP